MKVFANRTAAGGLLAQQLRRYIAHGNTLVLALPRGGVPVAYEIATELDLPLDVLIVRKLGAPGQQEFALGAMASGGVRVINPDAQYFCADVEAALQPVIAREKAELERRQRLYRSDLSPAAVRGRTVIVVDDGAATGSSMRAAVQALKKMDVGKIIVALPTVARDTCTELSREADEIVCLDTPEPFYSVGRWYEDFGQTTDEEVCALLERARGQREARVRNA